jgi:hypothetical protein
MRSHHILWNCKRYSDDQTIVLFKYSVDHPLHCGFDVWGAVVDTSTLKECALKISDGDWFFPIHHCVGKGPDDLRMLSWKFSLEPPEAELHFFVDNRGGDP